GTRRRTRSRRGLLDAPLRARVARGARRRLAALELERDPASSVGLAGAPAEADRRAAHGVTGVGDRERDAALARARLECEPGLDALHVGRAAGRVPGPEQREDVERVRGRARVDRVGRVRVAYRAGV